MVIRKFIKIYAHTYKANIKFAKRKHSFEINIFLKK